MNDKNPMATTICPECDSLDYHVDTYFDREWGNNAKGSEHRFCKACGQEYFTDIDYKETGDL